MTHHVGGAPLSRLFAIGAARVMTNVEVRSPGSESCAWRQVKLAADQCGVQALVAMATFFFSAFSRGGGVVTVERREPVDLQEYLSRLSLGAAPGNHHP